MNQTLKQNRETNSLGEPCAQQKNSIVLSSFWKGRRNLLFLGAILLISFLVYLPSLQNGFVNWDDEIYIYENPLITSTADWDTLFESTKDIFSTPVNAGYTPIVILSFALEKILYGFGRPGWWHFNNIILHLICVLLVFRIALTLGLKIIPAAFCALLFGIHPMRVESVAWITERKDVLYGSFYLLALYYYIKSVKLSFRKRYVLIILTSFILALLSKIQAVVLPLSMLLVDYFFDRNLSIKLVYEKWLYFLFSLITGVVGIYFLSFSGFSEVNKATPLVKRIFFGSYSYVVYIIKSIIPYEMVPLYPFPDKISLIFYASLLLVLLTLGLIYYFYLKGKKVLVFGLLFFTVNVMFVLQIKIGGKAFLADRYTYISYFGLFFIYALGIQWALGRYKRFEKVIYLGAVLLLCFLGYLNFEQNTIWKNSETLWSHVLKYYPDKEATPWYNRGNYYLDKGRLKEALYDFDNAIILDPSNSEAFVSRGSVYFKLNIPEQALKNYETAGKLDPNNPKVFIGRGNVYSKLNMFEEALHDFDAAEKLDPDNPAIYYNRAPVYQNLGRHDKVQADLEKYVNLNPDDPKIWSNLGLASRFNRQYEKSLNAFNMAIQLAPNELKNYNQRAMTYWEMGDIERARNDLQFLNLKGFKGINPEFEKLLVPGKSF
jgi:tetratricopeptide (TPR) repeat protein